MSKWLIEYKLDLPRKRKIFKKVLEAPGYKESRVREILLEIHPDWKILKITQR